MPANIVCSASVKIPYNNIIFEASDTFNLLNYLIMDKFERTPKYPSSNTKHAPGQIYIILAGGFHGIFPGLFLYRCKIGLAVDAHRRLKQLQSIQAPCNYKLLKVIHVRDMASVETKLHQQFSECNVQLNQSREWFDLNLWQLWSVYHAFRHHGTYPKDIQRVQRFPLQAIALVVIGMLILAAITDQLNTARNMQEPERIHQHSTQPDTVRFHLGSFVTG